MVQGWAEIYPVKKSQTDRGNITELLKIGMQKKCPGYKEAKKKYPDLSRQVENGAAEECNKLLETEFNKLLSAEKVVAFADPAIREVIIVPRTLIACLRIFTVEYAEGRRGPSFRDRPARARCAPASS